MYEELLAQAIRYEHAELIRRVAQFPYVEPSRRRLFGHLNRRAARQHHDLKFRKLQRLESFASMTDQELRILAAATTELHLPPGRTLATEGRNANEVYLVASGEVQITMSGDVVGVVGRGALLGVDAMIAHAPRDATFISATDVEVFVVEPRCFAALCDDLPAFARLVEQSTYRRDGIDLRALASPATPKRHHISGWRRIGLVP